ncbi:trypsin-like peptidase domain-containing protein [Ruegeria lacuscaerulensis]|uniref:trypsin-like peptidase domain-containing protein n=1 Tax=Ruegeria lacuscaerulensis TaxID=55218 RepID=UPI00147DF936|nr:trypsin-like peptidase domain-containing protein [Ruegeria lacuscaerulensis]
MDANNNTLSWASGIVVDEMDFPSIYTCWHVVSGADPHNLPSNAPPKRHVIRVHTQGIEKRTPEITAIGGLQTFDFDLYDKGGKPTWLQGPSQEGLDAVDLPPPTFDCVRFDVSSHRHLLPGAFKPQDDIRNRLDVPEDAFIVGYPYAYSPYKNSPDPIFLRRSPACLFAPRGYILLDGPGAKGMSGGPIVTRVDNEWRLAGIYNGVLFPEATYFEEELSDNNGKSQLPLGKYTMSVIARKVVGAPIESMGSKGAAGREV